MSEYYVLIFKKIILDTEFYSGYNGQRVPKQVSRNAWIGWHLNRVPNGMRGTTD